MEDKVPLISFNFLLQVLLGLVVCLVAEYQIVHHFVLKLVAPFQDLVSLTAEKTHKTDTAPFDLIMF